MQQTEELYEAARHEDLVAEKFEIDGTHVGSGGGNHLVLGGMLPSESPFLAPSGRARELARVLAQPPALSYLFSGRFIGPTSQAPRVDEARDDSTYELEIALAELQRRRGRRAAMARRSRAPPSLVDVTGNTHRTEFCIDKLFSPDGPTGRLGLRRDARLRDAAARAHERRAAAARALAALACSGKSPTARSSSSGARACTTISCCPFTCGQTCKTCSDFVERWATRCRSPGFSHTTSFDSRAYGELRLDDCQLEVRGALEPWLVLGEESTGGGQARYVDSSVERMQVLVQGWVEERYQLLCNRRVIPLQPTAQKGQFVGGVRFRAWQPPSCLHPTIGVHAPLHFDIYDTWSGRCVAGCTYQVVHPGGRAAEDRPVNAVAAESRRLARFEVRGHASGPFEPLPSARVHPHFPRTLDLRRG